MPWRHLFEITGVGAVLWDMLLFKARVLPRCKLTRLAGGRSGRLQSASRLNAIRAVTGLPTIDNASATRPVTTIREGVVLQTQPPEELNTVERGRRYEYAISDIFKAYNAKVWRTGGSGDRGVDLRGYWQLNDQVVDFVVQCKDVKRASLEHLRSFASVVYSQTRPNLGIYCTTMQPSAGQLQLLRRLETPLVLCHTFQEDLLCIRQTILNMTWYANSSAKDKLDISIVKTLFDDKYIPVLAFQGQPILSDRIE